MMRDTQHVPDNVFNPPLKNHNLSSSIWAPRPQRETAWPPLEESPFSQPFDEDATPFERAPRRTSSFMAPATNFAGISPSSAAPSGQSTINTYLPSGLGAIGDGRLHKTPPQHEDDHIETLLRTLNLHSPAPAMQRPLLGLHLNTTPDSSPCSDASSLATPSDLSPARFGLGLKLDSSLGLDLHGQFSHMAPPDHVRDFSAPEFDPYWINQPSVYGQSTLSSFLRPAHSIQSHMGTPAQVPTTLFDSYVDRPSPMSFGGPLPNFPSTTVQPAMSRAFFDQTASPSSPMSPAGHVRGLSTSGWATPRPVVPPGQWLRGGARPELHARAGSYSSASSGGASHTSGQDPVNFLSLLHPSSAPPYHSFVARVIKSSDQQASIFLQQKLKVAESDERARIIDAICNRGFEMMTHRFGNWAVQRCLEAATTSDEKRKIVTCMRGRVVDLATNCYGCHVLQKALDCEEDLRLLIVSELLLGDPASTLVNKHASHVWSKIMELTWTPPAPPIFAYINRSLKGQWASLACHETGSLVVQHAFENLEDAAKSEIVDEILNCGSRVFGEVVKSQWGAYCIQHILEHGSLAHRQMVLDHIINDLFDYATNEQAMKSVNKALKEGGQDMLDRMVKRLSEPARGGRRAMIVDLALSGIGAQLIGTVLPNLNKEQRSVLYDSIRSHIVTLRGCKTGSKVIWLFDRMRAYYGY